MTNTITVIASHDYTPDTLTDVADIVFSTGATATATFAGAQYVAGTISPAVHIAGDSQINTIAVNVAASGTFSAAGWTFFDWTVADSVFITGAAGSETIVGSSQANQIEGGGGADILTGGASADFFRYLHSSETIGAEQVYGGGGDDWLLVADTISGGDFDFSGASISGVEALGIVAVGVITVTMAGSQMGAGAITAAAVIDPPFPGPASNIALHVVGSSVDLSAVTFIGPISVSIYGSNGVPNSLIGSSSGEFITGSTVNDFINGGAGADGMAGGGGNDTYVVDDPGDVVDESPFGSDGTDTVRSSITFSFVDTNQTRSGSILENLVLTGNGIIGTGNSVGNTITGLGAGVIMRGLGGDDTYVVDDLGDFADETVGGSSGTDTVSSSLNYTLGVGLEHLILTGAATNGTGNDLNNTIVGNANANRLDGQGGADTMVGGAGNDTYVLDNAGDVADENGGSGIDTIEVAFDFTLNGAGNALGGAIENIVLTGSAVSATGNGLANILTGNTVANVLDGAAGDDRLFGGDGGDQLIGSDGADRLIGGLGLDLFTGGAGADTFAFTALADSGKKPATCDMILDFAKGDFIDLSAIDAKKGGGDNAFKFIKQADFHDKIGELHFSKKNGDVLLSGDVDGNGKADFAILFADIHKLAKGDFVL